MSWLRIDDGFAQHPKLQGWTAAQKWALVELFCYCARHKTEGYVPSDLALLPRAVTSRVLSLAEESGLIDQDEDGLLVIHDWQLYNPSDVTAAERMKRMRERNANRNEPRNARVTPSVTSRARDPVPSLEEPESKDSVSSAPRKPNPIWDALVEVFGEPSTDTARTLRGKVCSSLSRAGATPDELIARAKSWPRHFEDATLTETALEKHWDKLGRPPLRAAR
jgi:hypothetical protein